MKAVVGDVEIGYDRSGSGEPVLLVMGLATGRFGWVNQFGPFSERYDVTCFDNRGVGESSAPTEPWTMADMAADAVGLMDAIGYERAHVVGISMGGMISQEIVLGHPERVRSLTLVATHHGGSEAELPAQDVLEALASPDPDERVRKGVWHTFGRTYREAHPEIVEMAVEFAMQMQPPFHGVLNQVMAITNWSAEGGTADRLSEIRVPTLVLQGGEDELVPPRNGELLAGEIPGADHRFFPDAGHAIVQEKADEVNEAILAHLESASARV